MIQHLKGDIFKIASQGGWDFVVHGANCFHTMGSGIAKQIKQQFPEVYAADLKTPMARRDKLGTWSAASTGCGFIIINLYTQYGYNDVFETKDRVEYTAAAKGLNDLANSYPGCNWLFPYIGMGRAAGNKERIMKMLEDFSDLVEIGGGKVGLVEFQA